MGDLLNKGGSFSFYNYDLSKQISRRKVEDIEATKASVVVTGCPGCMLQLKDQLGQRNSPVEVRNLIQLVDDGGGPNSVLNSIRGSSGRDLKINGCREWA